MSFLYNFQGYTLSCVCAQSPQLCLTLCNPMDCSPPGSSVHGILQARILGWVAMPFSRGIFLTQGLNLHLLCFLQCRQNFYPLSYMGRPYIVTFFEPKTELEWSEYLKWFISDDLQFQLQRHYLKAALRIWEDHGCPPGHFLAPSLSQVAGPGGDQL